MESTSNFDIQTYDYAHSMVVVYSCDDGFAHVLGVSLLSLLESQEPGAELVVFIFCDQVSPENCQALGALCSRFSVKFCLLDISPLAVPEYAVSRIWSRSAFMRVYMGELLPPSLKKVLYLDCDTLILGSLKALWQTDVSHVVLAAAQDCPLEKHKRDIGLTQEQPYINSGILLINLDAFRKVVTPGAVSEAGARYSPILEYPDQDIINILVKDQIALLEPKYNAMTLYYEFSYPEILQFRKPLNYYSQSAVIEAAKTPCILHFTASFLTKRPWMKGCKHPYGNLYQEYRSRTPWSQQELPPDTRPPLKKLYSSLFEILPRGMSIRLSGWIYNQAIPMVRGLWGKWQ